METVSILGTDSINVCAADSHSKVEFFSICGTMLVCTKPSPLRYLPLTLLCLHPEGLGSSFFPSGSDGKDSACNAGGPGSIPGS